jgi:hypothetical protein
MQEKNVSKNAHKKELNTQKKTKEKPCGRRGDVHRIMQN